MEEEKENKNEWEEEEGEGEMNNLEEEEKNTVSDETNRVKDNDKIERKTNREKKERENKQEFTEALDKYYQLKESYEETLRQAKNEIKNNKSWNWKEKRLRWKRIQPKCIVCKKPGGTIFKCQYEEESESRKLTAQCGNEKSPCNLDIVIYLGDILRIDEILHSDENELNELRNDIIVEKNDYIFGYTTENQSIENFDALKNKLNDLTMLYEHTFTLYIEKADNVETRKKCEEWQREIEEHIFEIKRNVREFDTKHEETFLEEAVNIYVHSLMPRMEEFTKLAFPIHYVDYNDKTGMYHLEEKNHTLDLFEKNYAKKYGVETFQM